MTYIKQDTQFSCGAAATKNALLFLGKRVSIKTIRDYAETTKDGTTDKGIKRALKELGYEAEIYLTKSENAFKNRLIRNLKKGNPVIVLVDNCEHWCCVIEYKNRQIIFIDSDRERKRIRYEYSLVQFLLRARNLNKEHPEKVYFELIEVKK